MSISVEEVRQIAALARLELDEPAQEEMARDLGSILDHMEALARVGTDDVEPMGGVSDHAAPMREDAPGADPLERTPDSFAPAWREGFFVVPRLAALDGDAIGAEGSSA